jgi:hypothetical protein
MKLTPLLFNLSGKSPFFSWISMASHTVTPLLYLKKTQHSSLEVVTTTKVDGGRCAGLEGTATFLRVIVDCNLLMLLIPSKFLCWLGFDSECGFCFVYGYHGDLPPTHHSTTLQSFLSITAGGRIKIGRGAGDGGP